MFILTWFHVVPQMFDLVQFWVPFLGPQGPHAAGGTWQTSISEYVRLHTKCSCTRILVQYLLRLTKMLWATGLHAEASRHAFVNILTNFCCLISLKKRTWPKNCLEKTEKLKEYLTHKSQANYYTR